MTPTEALVWEHLRDRKFHGLKFRRQHPIGPYVADFFCAELGLVLEIDGGAHNDPEQQTRDRERTLFLQGLGFEVVRISNSQVESHPGTSSHPSTAQRTNLPSPSAVGEGSAIRPHGQRSKLLHWSLVDQEQSPQPCAPRSTNHPSPSAVGEGPGVREHRPGPRTAGQTRPHSVRPEPVEGWRPRLPFGPPLHYRAGTLNFSPRDYEVSS
ncbi:MAG: endonuclease domain-containing protein, partial [Tepidiformaceae bacterium]